MLRSRSFANLEQPYILGTPDERRETHEKLTQATITGVSYWHDLTRELANTPPSQVKMRGLCSGAEVSWTFVSQGDIEEVMEENRPLQGTFSLTAGIEPSADHQEVIRAVEELTTPQIHGRWRQPSKLLDVEAVRLGAGGRFTYPQKRLLLAVGQTTLERADSIEQQRSNAILPMCRRQPLRRPPLEYVERLNPENTHLTRLQDELRSAQANNEQLLGAIATVVDQFGIQVRPEVVAG